MGYCFMDIKKIKSLNIMAAKYKHNYREITVPNAVPELSGMNRELVPLVGKDGTQIDYNEAFKQKLESLEYYKTHKLRSNAVLAYEIVTTFSHEDADKVDIEKWQQDNVKWLKDTFNLTPENGNCVLSVMYHGDEYGNVHCHSLVVPVNEQGKICASRFTDGKAAMRELQDSYAEAMRGHGLKRGIERSSAKHQDIKKFYTKLNQTMDIPLPEKGESAVSFRERILSQIQSERAAYLREYLKKETKLQQTVDLQSERAKKAAMNIAAAERAEFKEEGRKLRQKNKDLSKQIGKLEKKYVEMDKLCGEMNEEYLKLEEKSRRALQDLNKVEKVKEIVEESTYRNNVMFYISHEMPDFADPCQSLPLSIYCPFCGYLKGYGTLSAHYIPVPRSPSFSYPVPLSLSSE